MKGFVVLLVTLLVGCASIGPPVGTIMEKIVEPQNARMIALSPNGSDWIPMGEGHQDEFYLILAGNDGAGRPYKVRVMVDKGVWETVNLGSVYLQDK